MKVQLPVHKKDVITTTIDDLSYEGMGVAKVDHYPLFVENALPGEKVILKVTKTNKNYGFADVQEWLSKSPERVEGVNVAYLQTGIAPLAHLKYDAQLKFKRQQIINLFQKQHLDIPVAETVGMTDPYHYRNKAQVPVRMINGKLMTGFYKKHSHQLVPMTDFKIQAEAIDHAIKVVRDTLRELNISAYDEQNHTGTVRNIMVRYGFTSHELMVVLVTRTATIPQRDRLVARLCEQLPMMTSLLQNVNEQVTNVILGKHMHLLFGKRYLSDELLGNSFDISAQSFYQVNPQQTRNLYQIALQEAQLTGEETVIDAYCGIGTISLSLAAYAKHVFGIEVVDQAVQDARHNAKINHINNTTFKAGKAENVMQHWQKQGMQPDVIVVDPPRKGLDESFINAAVAMQPQRIVYVSCNPATLARDLSIFTEMGYQPVRTTPVDMFPMTPHVESVTVLERTEK